MHNNEQKRFGPFMIFPAAVLFLVHAIILSWQTHVDHESTRITPADKAGEPDNPATL